MHLDLKDFPDDDLLSRGMASVLGMTKPQAGGVAILSRVRNLYASRSASEVVTCRTGDGTIVRFLCKFGARQGTGDRDGDGDRVAYEGIVYRTVLNPLRLSVPHCYGTYRDVKAGRSWLVLEYLPNTLRVSHDPAGETLMSAADWLGRFHAAAQAKIATEMPPLRRHDAGYYRGRARRALDFSGERASDWLQTVYERAQRFVAPLLAGASTVIHGEFYPQNVLVQDERVAPVDWETAAVAAGEIDLASLVDGWPPQIARRCEQQYRRARWPGRPPHDFEETLAAARVYWPLHWLGYRRGWLDRVTRDHYLSQLRATGERLDLV